MSFLDSKSQSLEKISSHKSCNSIPLNPWHQNSREAVDQTEVQQANPILPAELLPTLRLLPNFPLFLWHLARSQTEEVSDCCCLHEEDGKTMQERSQLYHHPHPVGAQAGVPGNFCFFWDSPILILHRPHQFFRNICRRRIASPCCLSIIDGHEIRCC